MRAIWLNLLFLLLSASMLSAVLLPLRQKIIHTQYPRLSKEFVGEMREVHTSLGKLPISGSETLSLKSGDMSLDGHRAVFYARVSSGEGSALLWEDGLGFSRLSELKHQVVGAPVISDDGTKILYFARQSSPHKAYLYFWEEGFGVQKLVDNSFEGKWKIELSGDGRAALLIPENALSMVSQLAPGKTLFVRIGSRVNNGKFSRRLASAERTAEVSVMSPAGKPETGWQLKSLEAGRANFLELDKADLVKRSIRLPGNRRLAANDVDGDGTSDLLTFKPGGELPVWRAYSSGGLGGGAPKVTGVTGLTYSWRVGDNAGLPIPGDYNGDGKLDLATFFPDFNSGHVSSHGNWRIYFSDNSNLRLKPVVGPLGKYLSISFGLDRMLPVPADYDGDGADDIAVYDSIAGNWHIIFASGGFNMTKGTLQMPGFGRIIHWGHGGIPVVGDYNGDGKEQPALFFPAKTKKGKAKWLIFQEGKKAGQGETLEIPFGMRGDIPLVGDFDCDGKSEIAVFRRTSGRWHIKDFGNESIKSVSFVPLANRHKASAEPIVADFDGDGCSDLAFFVAGRLGRWEILPSVFKEQAMSVLPAGRNVRTVFNWGGSGELPVQVILRNHYLKMGVLKKQSLNVL